MYYTDESISTFEIADRRVIWARLVDEWITVMNTELRAVSQVSTLEIRRGSDSKVKNRQFETYSFNLLYGQGP
jgi:hypothetical protein